MKKIIAILPLFLALSLASALSEESGQPPAPPIQPPPAPEVPDSAIGFTGAIAIPLEFLLINEDGTSMVDPYTLGLRFELGSIIAMNFRGSFLLYNDTNNKTNSENSTVGYGLSGDILIKSPLTTGAIFLWGPQVGIAGLKPSNGTEFFAVILGAKIGTQVQLNKSLGLTFDTGFEFRLTSETSSTTDHTKKFFQVSIPTVGLVFYL